MFPPAFPPTPSGLDSPAFPGTGTGLRPPTVPSNGSLSLTRVIRLLALKDYRAGSQKRSCSASSQLSSAGPPDLRSGPAGPDLAAPASAGALAGVVPRASPSSPGVPSCLRVFVPSSHRVFVSSCLRPFMSSCLRLFVPSSLPRRRRRRSSRGRRSSTQQDTEEARRPSCLCCRGCTGE